MRIGYANGIIENQLVASASLNLNYPISNVLNQHMIIKYKSLGSDNLLVTMRDNTISGHLRQVFDSETKIVASDAQTLDEFGYSVAISGDYAIVGAYLEDGGGGDPISNAGASYIFHRTGDNTWDSGTKIVASDAQADDKFGYSVAISGDYAIVGAYTEGVSNAGASYIFHRTGDNTWDSGTKIVASDAQADDEFGNSVAISGDYAIIGARSEDDGGGGSGASYIFHRTGTNTWDSGTKIVASDAQIDDRFGNSVAISGDYAIVGAFNEDGGSGDPMSNAGASYIFYRTGTNTWDSGTKIVASDAQTLDLFGWSVAISGDYAIVGAYLEDGGDSDPMFNAGASYIFHRTGTNTWDTGTKIVASDSKTLDWFGWSVAISGDYAIVGASNEGGTNTGASYVFKRTGTNTWDTGTKIISSDIQADDEFGFSVSITEDYIISGARNEDGGDGDPISNAGTSYIFKGTDIGTQPINASMCVINAHNMVSDDTAILKGYESDISDTPLVIYNFTFQEYGMAVIFDEADLFWEIELTVANPVEIGGIFLGQHLITPAYEIGAETKHVTTDTSSTSKSGQLYGDEGYIVRTAKYLLPHLTEIEKPDWLTLWNTVRNIVPFYLLQYPDRQDIQPVFYCHFTMSSLTLQEHEGNRSVYKDVPITIEEVF